MESSILVYMYDYIGRTSVVCISVQDVRCHSAYYADRLILHLKLQE
jgi:hypothetical protein